MPGTEGFNGMKGAEVGFLAVVALVIGCFRVSFTPIRTVRPLVEQYF